MTILQDTCASSNFGQITLLWSVLPILEYQTTVLSRSNSCLIVQNKGCMKYEKTYNYKYLFVQSRVPSYQELFSRYLHAMQSSTHHTDIQYHQHVFLKPIFFLHFWTMEGMAPSDPFHFSEVPKTCEQPRVPAIDVPERSTYCTWLVISNFRWLK